MGRPAAKQAFSAQDTARYQEIAKQVAATGKATDAKAACARIEAALGKAGADTASNWSLADDAINEKDADFVGFVLGGYNSGGAMSGAELAVTTEDVYVEEPRVVAGDDEDEEGEERSIWGDGDDEPGADNEE
ncbi:unnamed protein product [Polarella glacialis]|uniref:Uncharacterized protein n=1 Tax=Polarella glacialis TaxID=89957 RepID=A0A813E1N7_POLGL|nr:unnamed protein product [Polarella glacialis]CAE8685396.1 unnamed protein product [Polarella glacialis]